ncbi:MAG: ribonuclease H-like domain-containing protein [Melioribacter sp.]|uniref:ribonuclease H-like domain-containing protein n=1 Tax=Melioribacter sp. TaxID=2052167 RepID=UPI003BD670BE
MNLVFDIETTAYDFESLEESQQEFLLRYAEQEKDEILRAEKIEEAKRFLNLYPFTAKVIVIGMLNTESEHSLILFESEDNEEWRNEEGTINYKGMSEVEMLNTFWNYVNKVESVITFNGRAFDIPFLMLRSAKLGIKPSRNLIARRYDTNLHIDLLEQFTFYGLTKKFNLDFYCRSFGIESPKSEGITGMEVNQLYRAGRIKEIAVYCSRDVRATFELYKVWKKYLYDER